MPDLCLKTLPINMPFINPASLRIQLKMYAMGGKLFRYGS